MAVHVGLKFDKTGSTGHNLRWKPSGSPHPPENNGRALQHPSEYGSSKYRVFTTTLSETRNHGKGDLGDATVLCEPGSRPDVLVINPVWQNLSVRGAREIQRISSDLALNRPSPYP